VEHVHAGHHLEQLAVRMLCAIEITVASRVDYMNLLPERLGCHLHVA
jgi:hypothetical protein